VVFLIGLGFAIAAMVATQHDTERPSISADSYDAAKRSLKVTVSVEGLAADQRIVVFAEGLVEKKKTAGQTRTMPKRRSRTRSETSQTGVGVLRVEEIDLDGDGCAN